MSGADTGSQRIDKWLWHARMFRTRSLASRFAATGKIRVNGTRISKASHPVAPGDALTFPLGERIRVLKIVALAERRGPFSEASLLYDDLTVDVADDDTVRDSRPPARSRGAGRPTKLERRKIKSFTTSCDSE